MSFIFKWHRGNFEEAAGSPGQFLALYASTLGMPRSRRRIPDDGEISITFGDCD